MIPSHILFDLDGTLIDSAPTIIDTLSSVLRSRSIKANVELGSWLIGPPLREVLTKIVGSSSPGILDDLMENFVREYDSKAYRFTSPFEGVDSTLSTLKEKGHFLYIVTNKRIAPTRLILEHLDWAKYFEGVYSQDAFDPRLGSKKEAIDRAIEIHNIPRDQAIYIGDRFEDEDAARGVGIAFGAATWGYTNWPNGLPSLCILKPTDIPSRIPFASRTDISNPTPSSTLDAKDARPSFLPRLYRPNRFGNNDPFP